MSNNLLMLALEISKKAWETSTRAWQDVSAAYQDGDFEHGARLRRRAEKLVAMANGADEEVWKLKNKKVTK